MERSAWPKNLSSSRKHAIMELLHDQNPTKKVRDLFDAHSQAGNNTGQPLFAEDLVISILRSGSNTLSESMSAESNEVLPVPSNAYVRSEVSKESESIKSPVPRKTYDTRMRRDKGLIDNGHQWRKPDQNLILNFEKILYSGSTLDSQSIITSELIHNGHQWREYGPKLFAGQYYRCAYRIDQGCEATKHVQNTLHDPILLQITYTGRHTCEIPFLKLNPDSSSPRDNSGQHTCENPFLKLNLDSSSPGDNSITLSLNTSLIAEQNDDNNNSILNLDSSSPGDDSVPLIAKQNDDNNNPILNPDSPSPRDDSISLSLNISLIAEQNDNNNNPILNPDSSSPRDDSIPLSFNTSLIAEQDNDNNNPIFFNFLSANQEQKIDQGCQATKLTHLQEPHPQRPGDSFIPLSFNSSLFAQQDDDHNNQEQKLPGEDDLNPNSHSHEHNSNNNNNNRATSSDYYASAQEI